MCALLQGVWGEILGAGAISFEACRKTLAVGQQNLPPHKIKGLFYNGSLR